MFYQAATDEWIDFQIMYELYDAVGLDPKKLKKYVVTRCLCLWG